MWRMAAIGLELPTVIAISVAVGASSFAAVMGRGAIYFDAVALVIALAITSRWVLAGGVCAARSHVEAARRQSTSALRLVAFPSSLATESVTAQQLKPGARVLVPPGEAVPSDGVVVHGRSSSSQASLTGESLPVEKSAGAPVLAGAINLDQPLVIEVGRSGTESSSLALQRMAEEAGRDRPRTDELAARFAAPYLWLMGSAALMTLLGWLLVDPSQAVSSVIAVLIAACPCALLLASPAATAGGAVGVGTARCSGRAQLRDRSTRQRGSARMRQDRHADDRRAALVAADCCCVLQIRNTRWRLPLRWRRCRRIPMRAR